MNQDIVENVNVAADQYWAIADELGTEHGWSVLEHVQLCKELLQKSLVAIGPRQLRRVRPRGAFGRSVIGGQT